MKDSFELEADAPLPITADEYQQLIKESYQNLLSHKGDDEAAFQDFFAKNPHIVPGSRSEMDFGPSGHGPARLALVDRPRIKGIFDRQPDFVWLSYDSMNFTPVLIEIEAPAKRYFTRGGYATSDFAKAKNQLDEWVNILQKPQNQLLFFESFDLDERLRKAVFKPIFLLIYGRREEYQNDYSLSNKRSTMVDQGSRQYLMSFDRLSPVDIKINNFVTCSLQAGKFIARHLPPTFKVGPYEDHFLEIDNLVDAVDAMEHTTLKRKDFLKRRIPHWIQYMKRPQKTGWTLREFNKPHQE